MSLFEKRERVYGPETVSVGDLDLTVDGGYRNVVIIPLDVKPRRVLHVKVSSNFPVDVVVANENGATVGHKKGVRDAVLGPYPTEKLKSMGIFLGLYPGDRAKVALEAWMEKERWYLCPLPRTSEPLRGRSRTAPSVICS